MARKILIDSRTLPYHICARANNREAFPGDIHFVWKTLTSELYLQQILHGMRVHAFVLMPNDFHLIATYPSEPMDLCMKELLASSTRIINTRWKRWGRVFGGRYNWSLIGNAAYYAHAMKYVYRNPVKASLVEGVADYPFGTFAGLCGERTLPVVVQAPLGGIDAKMPEHGPAYENLERWLNQPHSKEVNRAIQVGLKKMEFEPGRNRSTRNPVNLE